jgi:hypothetical protein
MLVVVVKIDDPKGGKYHGGQTAAPVTRAMLEEALAARRSTIDRSRLLSSSADPGSASSPATVTKPADVPDEADTRREIVQVPLTDSTTPRSRTLVPVVSGSSIRRAANALHRRGFHVAVRGSGKALRTTPAAGDSANTGATVTVWAE